MNQKKKTAGASVNLLFTMLLFLVFLLCALFTVLFGSRVYENISSRSENKDTGSVALHYIANKVRQGDREGAVDVIDVDGTPDSGIDSERRPGGLLYLDLLSGRQYP